MLTEIHALAEENLVRLKNSAYPGRGLVAGITPSGAELVQMYWIMGRSPSSKNRVMVRDGNTVKTVPFDRSQELKRENLILYNAAAQAGGAHIATNGRQTDAIAACLERGGRFEEALREWSFEDDAPIFTPRISSAAFVNGGQSFYQMSIIKALDQNPKLLSRQFFDYAAPFPGYGHCIHTYSLSQICMPFHGEPYWVPLFDEMNENAEYYWRILPEDKRVALYIKHIDLFGRESKDRIINRNTEGK